jgi:prepilin-type N-terminal cleavage/methylation domain-containing protein
MFTPTTSHARCKRPAQRPGRRICCANCRSRSRLAFTLIELIIALGVIAVLLALLFPAVVKVRATQRSTACTANLRQIGTAFHLYAQDNSFRLPVPALANRSWEQMLSPYCKGAFVCPADGELATVVGSSYDWRDTGIAHTTLAGRSVAETLRPSTIIAFEALPGWHTRGRINVARLDNSVSMIPEEEFFSDLNLPAIGGFVPLKN